MPQMAPLMWVPLFFVFSTLLFLTFNKIFYSSLKIFFSYNLKSLNKNNDLTLPQEWKW